MKTPSLHEYTSPAQLGYKPCIDWFAFLKAEGAPVWTKDLVFRFRSSYYPKKHRGRKNLHAEEEKTCNNLSQP